MAVVPVSAQGSAATLAAAITQTFSPFPGAISVGDTIEMNWRIGNVTATVTSISDNLGNTWTADIARKPGSAGFSLTKYRCVVTTGGSCTISVTHSLIR